MQSQIKIHHWEMFFKRNLNLLNWILNNIVTCPKVVFPIIEISPHSKMFGRSCKFIVSFLVFILQFIIVLDLHQFYTYLPNLFSFTILAKFASQKSTTKRIGLIFSSTSKSNFKPSQVTVIQFISGVILTPKLPHLDKTDAILEDLDVHLQYIEHLDLYLSVFSLILTLH